MANPGVGNKFVSVNLNKSYGQQQHHHSSSYSSRTARTPNSYHHGGGGMVVLSRPRSSQKTGPKLSVPPPMNLPSLRKEHEKFDSLGTGGGPIGGGVPGSGLRPSSSGMRWTKPVTLQEKEDSGLPIKGVNDHDIHGSGGDGLSSKRTGSALHSSIAGAAHVAVENSPVLRGEDFPSLRASLPIASGPSQKLKDRSTNKQKQLASEVATTAIELREGPNMSSHVDMRPQQMSSRHSFPNGIYANESENASLGSYRMLEQSRKEDEYFSGPLPLVRLNPRSDWADDERDTGHGLIDRGKDNGFVRTEAYWEGDFDAPKSSYLPLKSGHSYFDQWTLRDSDTGNFSSSEASKAESRGRDVRTPSREGREGNSWRASSPLSKDNISMHEAGIDRNRFFGRPSDNKYVPSLFRDGLQNDVGRNGLGGKLPWNNTRDRYGSDHIIHHNLASKASVGSRVPPFIDAGPKLAKEKRLATKSEKPYTEDPVLKDFGDGWDPLPGNIIGVVKRRKDVLKDTDFHDPVRESFEAELERVQKMQEQERQRIIEEQERALELVRREEEERARLAREQEEMQRRLEEEAQKAAWRAEQERLEALQKAEEQRTAREEEKRRIVMEEERRKHAAKQKLVELEERIAKRQAEAMKDGSKSSLADEKVSELVKEKDISGLRERENFMSDGGDWEDTERTVERIATPASSDLSSLNKPFEMRSRPNLSRGSSSSLVERGKPSNIWRRDPSENGNSSALAMTERVNSPYSPRRDAPFGGKSFLRKELYGGVGFGASRNYNRVGDSDFQMDAYSLNRGHRWNLAEGDPFNRNTDVDPEFTESLADKFGDVPWGHGPPHNNPLYPEQDYNHPEADGPYSSGRSRHSMRQPRVPPPPSLASVHTRRCENERPGPSSFLGGTQYRSIGRREPDIPVRYDSGRQENVEMESVNMVVEQKPDKEAAPRCDSQSSLSVSSPPDSPVHFSHDDLDESGDYTLKSAAIEDGDFLVTGNTGQVNIMTVPSSASSSLDEGEWALDNNSGLQEQEEYDEDEEGYRDDEVREGEDENIHLCLEVQDMHLEDKTSASVTDGSVVVVGFNEDVRVQLYNNEIEISSQKEVGTIPARTVSAEEEESFERDAQTYFHVDDPPQVTIDRQETETGIQAAVTMPVANTDDKSKNHVLSAHQAAPSVSTSVVSQSAGQTFIPSVPAFPTQAEIPVKLQFGLFSGPSLIPTPVPAIQIGSIQMPLHLHPQSLGPVHPSQPPLFQFGQLRYTSPISTGAVPLTPQSMSFLHPNVPTNFPLNKNPEGTVSMQSGEDGSAQNLEKLNSLSVSMGTQQGLVLKPSDLSQGHVPRESNPLPAREKREHLTAIQPGLMDLPVGESNSISSFQAEEQVDKMEGAKSYQGLSNSKEWEGQAQKGGAPLLAGKYDRDFAGSKSHGSVSSSRGKHYIFKVKNDLTKSAFPYSETSQSDGSGHQRRPRHLAKRTEFRVRDNGEKRQTASFGSTDQMGLGDGSDMNRRDAIGPAKSGSRKSMTNRVTKHSFESEGKGSVSINIQELRSGSGAEMTRKESSIKGQVVQQLHSMERNSKRDTREDVDSSLQSGVVRVFEQPGIEAPSDEDDFIEVRSKRQMLNDKREQREKEIKAKSRVSKASRRSRSFLKGTMSVSLRTTAPSGDGTSSCIQTDFADHEAQELADFEVSSALNSTLSSQQLAPIGTPAKSDASADLRSLKISSLPIGTGQNIMPGPGLAFKDKIVEDAPTSLDPWETPGINQPVMALTQSQLDDAMKSANYDSRISSGDHTIAVSEHIIPSSSILAKDKQFSSAASSINSLLAGEKIQFGAVTSPAVLPVSDHSSSHGIEPPGPCQLDIQTPHKIHPAENNCIIFLNEKSDESCVHLEDCEAEAEAEAAASAVAVAAISNDEIIGNGLGTRSLSVSDTKSYVATNEDRIAAGVAGDQQSANQSKAEEPLSVSLPADLSVETPPISLWPPLTPSQVTSTQMLSHFPAGPPSHFPFYDMNVNSMMGSPIFAFGPNEESSEAPQSHAQKSSGPNSGPHATWQHSGVDSFYGGPTGFTGPFISPGGISGVQAPPHMVVYNHFAPVGQFGQVGLSFMGTAFIPSGKQPDWKHNPSRPCTTVGEGDVNDMNAVSTQRNGISIPSPIQHLAPGSPLLPMASPLPMFDVSPFQSSPDVPVHARWSPLPSSTFQSVSMTMPMQQTEGLLPPPLPPHYPNKNNNVPPPVEQSEGTNRSADSSPDFHVAPATDSAATQLPNELGLVEEPSGSSHSGPSKQVGAAAKSAADSGNTGVQPGNNNQSSSRSTSVPFITRPRNSQQYRGPSTSFSSGYGNSHRRGAGFQGGGRNHSFSSEKGLSSSSVRVKQIYVAKQRNQSAAS